MHEIVETRWLGKMAFESHIDNHLIFLDAGTEHGGMNKGPRPKPLLLTSLAGCTGMDIVSILTKKRVDFTTFTIRIDASLTDSHPKYYNKIHLVFTFTGADFKSNDEILSKIKRAVELSGESYCSVSAMLRLAADITWEIILEND